MKRLIICAVLCTGLLATPIAFSSAPAAGARPAGTAETFSTYWKTPGEAAYCRVLYGPVRLTCWTPNDGFTITLYTTRQPVTRYWSGHRDFYASVRVLPFGYFFSAGRGLFRCENRRDGLTCRNSAAHGFWLGRYHGYRIF